MWVLVRASFLLDEEAKGLGGVRVGIEALVRKRRRDWKSGIRFDGRMLGGWVSRSASGRMGGSGRDLALV